MTQWSEGQLKWYDHVNKARPSHTSHGINVEDLNEHMKELRPTSWHLKGNTLVGETEMGPLVQNIPTNVILKGTDDKGLPIFEEVVLQ